MPTASAEDPWGSIQMHLAETFPMRPSDSIEPSAFAVGMPRKVDKNRSTLGPYNDAIGGAMEVSNSVFEVLFVILAVAHYSYGLYSYGLQVVLLVTLAVAHYSTEPPQSSIMIVLCVGMMLANLVLPLWTHV